MSLLEAGYGSRDGQSGSEISRAVSGVTTPGASRLQASQLQERSATTQRLQCQATFPRVIQSWGLWPLLLVLPRMTQSRAPARHLSLGDPVPGAQRLLLLDQPWVLQSGLCGLHRPLDDRVRGAAAPAAWLVPDDPVRNVWPPLSPNDPVRGAAAPAVCSAPDDPVRGVWTPFSSCCCPFALAGLCCFAPDDPVHGTPWPRHGTAASPRPRRGVIFASSPRAPPLGSCSASPLPRPLVCIAASPRH